MDTITFQQLKYVVTVAETGTITEAAGKLYVSQPSLTKASHTLYGTTREDLIEVQKSYKDINNRVIANAPKDMIINTHVCRGNFHSTYASEGACDSVADILLGEEHVNAYFLEYDDERSGGFAPLAKVSGEKKVVIGERSGGRSLGQIKTRLRL